MLPILQCNTVLEELWTCLAAGAKSEVLQLPAILISDALDRHPEKDNIVEAIIKLVADECLPRTMVIAACSYLLAVCGRYVRFYVTRINATLFTEISQTTFNLCAMIVANLACESSFCTGHIMQKIHRHHRPSCWTYKNHDWISQTAQRVLKRAMKITCSSDIQIRRYTLVRWFVFNEVNIHNSCLTY